MPEKETGIIPIEKCPVITISREYGALGRTLAAKLSERLGIPYYDRDFVKKTAEESGYAVEDVEHEGEELSTSGRMLNKILNSAVSYSSSYDGIYKAQKKVVLQLAQDPCIIVGRCADHILREEGKNVFCVYLYASVKDRLDHVAELAENGTMSIEKYIEKRDKLRKTYYKQYTGHEMGNANNYNICFDTGRINAETCADIIIDILSREQ
jgi:cytidylate kinase